MPTNSDPRKTRKVRPIPRAIKVSEAVLTDRRTLPVTCQLCGQVSDVVLEEWNVDGRARHTATLTICCKESERRAELMAVEPS